ncbi:cytochrome c biogenesis protein [Virgisporangium aliadipatigenens]|uniref:Cytochrome c biogenesis protein n=1 Tax=Virgisporangium aliadipatigenens TaxID=741659 RepID=A0A8J3YLC3_9ACTN|nr:cytochrome c biogenesis protein ResB [Virgisporangium aliadipatigenens]GIJ47296.1 cytochrome c biogenesis protein [Virgisporangium aliadipatigenens]
MSLLRNSWRQLTSMRTALVLLFLLALFAIPGSVFPQRSIGPEAVDRYLRDNPDTGPWLDRLQAFDVYSSVWFSAVYLLLFVSLVGCVVPRLKAHAVALIRVPPEAPKRLDRLPAHADDLDHDGDPEAAADALAALLKGRRFRVARRGRTISAEKGYLKETGNLVFHFALLALLGGMAAGGLYGWHGNRIVVTGDTNGFCSSTQQYDEYDLGTRVDAADLARFCVTLDSFRAEYLDSGQPSLYRARMSYAADGERGTRTVEVNHPLRLADANVYLLGTGYAPTLRYTDRAGRTQTITVPFLPQDNALTSYGLAAFPDANIGLTEPDGRPAQVAFDGLYLPTVPENVAHGASLFPAERDPRLMLRAYIGDLGLDSFRPQSVYALNFDQVEGKMLQASGDQFALKPGESHTLADGTKIEFLGTQPWIAVSVRHDPGEKVVLVGGILLVIGLLGSLTGRRRRVFFRVTPDGVVAGGLPRSEYEGFAAEFEQIVESARAALGERTREKAGSRDG